jgi:hypothetical protein
MQRTLYIILLVCLYACKNYKVGYNYYYDFDEGSVGVIIQCADHPNQSSNLPDSLKYLIPYNAVDSINQEFLTSMSCIDSMRYLGFFEDPQKEVATYIAQNEYRYYLVFMPLHSFYIQGDTIRNYRNSFLASVLNHDGRRLLAQSYYRSSKRENFDIQEYKELSDSVLSTLVAKVHERKFEVSKKVKYPPLAASVELPGDSDTLKVKKDVVIYRNDIRLVSMGLPGVFLLNRHYVVFMPIARFIKFETYADSLVYRDALVEEYYILEQDEINYFEWKSPFGRRSPIIPSKYNSKLDRYFKPVSRTDTLFY